MNLNHDSICINDIKYYMKPFLINLNVGIVDCSRNKCFSVCFRELERGIIENYSCFWRCNTRNFENHLSSYRIIPIVLKSLSYVIVSFHISGWNYQNKNDITLTISFCRLLIDWNSVVYFHSFQIKLFKT